MQNIRQSVFETNSSSSHSFSINVATGGKLETIIPDSMGNITFNGGDFSDGEFYIHETLDKANAIAVYCTLHDRQDMLDRFEDVVLKHTGASKIIYNIKVCGKDLNSRMASEFESYLLNEVSSKADIKNFIFNPNSKFSAEYGYDG